ncbi:hypothetical protein C8Q80DRAFT_929814 [Daedaleopsis nitida]|nr:hypothetical protein C8Q80DRAFT_929814 [Daedaleopsis nitida]
MAVTEKTAMCFGSGAGSRGLCRRWWWSSKEKTGVADEGRAGSRDRATTTPALPLLSDSRYSPIPLRSFVSSFLRPNASNRQRIAGQSKPVSGGHCAIVYLSIDSDKPNGRQSTSAPPPPPLTNDLEC